MSTQTDISKESAANKVWHEVYDWAESICVSLAIVMFLFSFCFKTVEVFGPSMNNTLHGRDLNNIASTSGDKLLVSNLFYTPEYGDIVVINSEAEQETIKVQNETKLMQARAEAEAKQIAAEAEAKANRVIAESITENLLKKMEMEARQEHGWVEVQGSSVVTTTGK